MPDFQLDFTFDPSGEDTRFAIDQKLPPTPGQRWRWRILARVGTGSRQHLPAGQYLDPDAAKEVNFVSGTSDNRRGRALYVFDAWSRPQVPIPRAAVALHVPRADSEPVLIRAFALFSPDGGAPDGETVAAAVLLHDVCVEISARNHDARVERRNPQHDRGLPPRGTVEFDPNNHRPTIDFVQAHLSYRQAPTGGRNRPAGRLRRTPESG